MTPFVKEHGIVVPLDRANVDTDQIIPKQFLKSIRRTGFGETLFFDWKRRADGTLDPEFPLNQAHFKDAIIMVVRNNFGCGSSREHAVWAVVQAGFRVVIAPTRVLDGNRVPAFADIFASNSVKNGLLTIELPETEVDRIFDAITATPGMKATVDLTLQTITLHGAKDETIRFEIDSIRKDHLLRGLDDIALTLEHATQITSFEAKHDTQLRAQPA
ncbi:MAG: 3-isopropylmalate dehydratase small subunit [Verrucomicrobia bacterium]|nr:3-isopropylmalate dehydratase small subunit [Verrucomicrobiota bacterium]